jgi:hypothetical protein
MSRTIRRRKDKYLERDALLTHDRGETEGVTYHYWGWCWRYYYLDPNSKEGKKAIARHHSDRGWFRFIGPGWFHNQYSQRPYRRRAKREIHKFFKDEDYEVMIESKPHREYWT